MNTTHLLKLLIKKAMTNFQSSVFHENKGSNTFFCVNTFFFLKVEIKHLNKRLHKIWHRDLKYSVVCHASTIYSTEV